MVVYLFGIPFVPRLPPPCTASIIGIMFVTLNPALTTLHDVHGSRCVSISAFVIEQLRYWYGISRQLCFIVISPMFPGLVL